MKVLLIGCGAVGLSLASALYASGAEVTLVARGATAEAIRANGIERRGILGGAAIPPEQVRVTESAERAGEGYDFIVVSTKASHNGPVAAGLAAAAPGLLRAGGLLVLFQNGFGNEAAFSGLLETRRIYHASFAIGFRRQAPSVSEVTVITAPVSIGSLFGAPAEGCAPLARAIDGGGIPCRVTGEIEKTLWAKLLYNCALNPLGAVLGTDYGGLLTSESSVAIVRHIIEEVFAVMHAAGHETFWPDAAAYQKDFFEKILPPTYGHRSSTLQDIERRLPTEIDSLNGAVVGLGRRFQVETPYNTVLTQIVKSLEGLYHAR